MAENPSGPPRPGAQRDHLANSRTLLAWVRTALTIMGFGFVVAKFGLLLPGSFIRGHAHLFSTIAGTILMLVGSICLIVGTASFVAVMHDIDAGRVRFNPTIHIMLAAFVVLVGILLAIYIVLTG